MMSTSRSRQAEMDLGKALQGDGWGDIYLVGCLFDDRRARPLVCLYCCHLRKAQHIIVRYFEFASGLYDDNRGQRKALHLSRR